jgi:enoyl-CoA hydratase
MGSLVNYRTEASSVRITMDDGKVNALSPQMLDELHAAFERASTEGLPVVLSGRQGIVSAGFDLKVLNAGGPAAADLLQAGFTLAEQVLSFPTPVVIACTGHTIAMGFFLLLSGDYRIGVAGPYKLTANEVAIGMSIPRAAVELCRHRLAPGYLDRVIILAEVFSPETALPAGILDRVVEATELDGAVDELVAQLATLDMGAHRFAKLRVRAGALAALKEAIAADDVEFRAAIEAAAAT